MDVTVQSIDDNVARLRLAGRITKEDPGVDDDLLPRVAGEEVFSRRVLLDFETVEYLDSSGVGWLLSLHRRCGDKGGSLVIHSLPPLVANVLKLLKLETVLTIVNDKRAAERHVGLDKA